MRPRLPLGVPAFAVALAALAAPGGAAGAAGAPTIQAPTRAAVGDGVTVRVRGLRQGSYSLTLVSDAGVPSHGVSCLAHLTRRAHAQHGALVLHGTIPATLHCYQGLAASLGPVATAPGHYHLWVADSTSPAGFDGRRSVVKAPLRITR